MSVISAVIFDLDGTLLDSLHDIAEAMNQTLAARGWPTHPHSAYLRMVGDGIETLARRAAPQEKNLGELVDQYRARYAQSMEQSTRPYDGVAAMLDGLCGDGLQLAVLSNKREDFTVALVKRQLPKWRFVEVRGEREGIPRKPDPLAALEIAHALGRSPSQIAFVGDTPIDMKTALAAKMFPVAVTWGFRTRDELNDAGARVAIDHPRELLAVLQRK
jgi:phosphoglycolate phosphatase